MATDAVASAPSLRTTGASQRARKYAPIKPDKDTVDLSMLIPSSPTLEGSEPSSPIGYAPSQPRAHAPSPLQLTTGNRASYDGTTTTTSGAGRISSSQLQAVGNQGNPIPPTTSNGSSSLLLESPPSARVPTAGTTPAASRQTMLSPAETAAIAHTQSSTGALARRAAESAKVTSCIAGMLAPSDAPGALSALPSFHRTASGIQRDSTANPPGSPTRASQAAARPASAMPPGLKLKWGVAGSPALSVGQSPAMSPQRSGGGDRGGGGGPPPGLSVLVGLQAAISGAEFAPASPIAERFKTSRFQGGAGAGAPGVPVAGAGGGMAASAALSACSTPGATSPWFARVGSGRAHSSSGTPSGLMPSGASASLDRTTSMMRAQSSGGAPPALGRAGSMARGGNGETSPTSLLARPATHITPREAGTGLLETGSLSPIQNRHFAMKSLAQSITRSASGRRTTSPHRSGTAQHASRGAGGRGMPAKGPMAGLRAAANEAALPGSPSVAGGFTGEFDVDQRDNGGWASPGGVSVGGDGVAALVWGGGAASDRLSAPGQGAARAWGGGATGRVSDSTGSGRALQQQVSLAGARRISVSALTIPGVPPMMTGAEAPSPRDLAGRSGGSSLLDRRQGLLLSGPPAPSAGAQTGRFSAHQLTLVGGNGGASQQSAGATSGRFSAHQLTLVGYSSSSSPQHPSYAAQSAPQHQLLLANILNQPPQTLDQTATPPQYQPVSKATAATAAACALLGPQLPLSSPPCAAPCPPSLPSPRASGHASPRSPGFTTTPSLLGLAGTPHEVLGGKHQSHADLLDSGRAVLQALQPTAATVSVGSLRPQLSADAGLAGAELVADDVAQQGPMMMSAAEAGSVRSAYAQLNGVLNTGTWERQLVNGFSAMQAPTPDAAHFKRKAVMRNAQEARDKIHR